MKARTKETVRSIMEPLMGDLILFSRATEPTRVAPLAGETAEILFFTGVRYYRMPDAVEPAPVKRARRRPARAKRVAPAPCHA